MKHALLHALTTVPSLNYKRGLKRLYAIATVCWVAAVAIDTAQRLMKPLKLSDLENADRTMQLISHAAAFALGPPFAGYMLGLSLGWALAGFRDTMS